jgi:hypothetical protein
MTKLVIALAALHVATMAWAQPRPSTTAMACRQAAGLVMSQGAVVLGTGGYTYDRFVRDPSYCVLGETTEPAWVPAGDTPQCFVGYRCRDRERRLVD